MAQRRAQSTLTGTDVATVFPAKKKRHSAFHGLKSADKSKARPAAQDRQNDEHDADEEELSPYEKQRLQKIKDNARVMIDLGLEDAVTVAQKSAPKPKTPAKRNRKKQSTRSRATEESDSFEEPESEDSGSEYEAAQTKRTKRVAMEARKPPVRAAAQKAAEKASSRSTRQSSKKGGSRYANVNLKTRRIKVSIFTEDTGKHQWHFATITASRTKQGKLEHLVKWDTVGEEDEWLNLEEEKHYLFEEGELEVTDDEGESEWRTGQVVEVFVEEENGEERTSLARLVQSLGGGNWRVGWFAEVPEVPKRAWNNVEFEAGKDIFYTVARQDLDESSFKRAVDVVFYTTSYRTVQKGQRRCRYLWDPVRCYLHRFTLDGKWLPELGKEIREMLQSTRGQQFKGTVSQEPVADAKDAAQDVESVVIPGRTGGARREGPELSDSDSDAQEENEDEEEEEEEDDDDDEIHQLVDGEEGEGGSIGTSSAGGYWAALNGASSNKAASLSWDAVEVADESAVAASMQRLPCLCKRERENLEAHWRGQFWRWREELRAGFNICFYGFGSKQRLIREFVSEHMTLGPVVEVNAFVPGLKLKKVLEQLLAEVFGVGTGGPKTLSDLVQCITAAVWDARVKAGLEQPRPETDEDAWAAMMEAISRSRGQGEGGEEDEDQYAARMEPRVTRGMADGSARSGKGPKEVTLVIHNIESPALQGADAQEALAALAAAPGVHLVASVDHVNAALAWSPKQRGRMQWIWADLTTLERYCSESPYAAGSGAMGGEDGSKSALVVLRSLNKNAKGVFALLLAQQLLDGAGLSFQALYERARERFLVSSEMAMRNHLTEMKDHKIVRERMGGSAGAAKQLYVPLPVEALRGILAELKDNGQLQSVLT